MPTFAILNENNKVINVVVADSSDALSSYYKVVENNKQNPAKIDSFYDDTADDFVESITILESASTAETVEE